MRDRLQRALRAVVTAAALAATLPAHAVVTAVVDVFPRPRIDVGSPRAHALTTFDLGTANANPRTVAGEVGPGAVTYHGALAAADDPRGIRTYLMETWVDAEGNYAVGIVAIDSITGAVVDRLAAITIVPSDTADIGYPGGLALSEDGQTLTTIVSGEPPVEMWRFATHPLALVAKKAVNAPLSSYTSALAMTDGDTRVLARSGDDLLLIAVSSGAVVARQSLSNLAGLVYDRDAAVIYASTSDGTTVRTFSPVTLAPGRTYAQTLRAYAFALDADGNLALKADGEPLDSVHVLDVRTGVMTQRGTIAHSVATDAAFRRVVAMSHLACPEPIPAACASELLAEVDTRTWQAGPTVPVDTRAADDPARESRPYAAVGGIGVHARMVVAVEYFNARLGHYFLTALPQEAALLDGGTFAGWARTGETFPVFVDAADTPDVTTPVCRYYGRPEKGLDTHFYSASPTECAQVATLFGDYFELETRRAFTVYPVQPAGTCVHGTVPVYRLYNQRADTNHRYTTSLAIRAQMMGEGWAPEGTGPDAVGFCVPRD